jgi:hypothetical protein
VKNSEISFSWIAIQSSQSISYFFPAPVSSYIRSQYRRPAIYRWLIERDGKASTYIGETENLEHRLYHYLKPGPSQKTNRRVREFLDEELAHGASIEFDVLLPDPKKIRKAKFWLKQLAQDRDDYELANRISTSGEQQFSLDEVKSIINAERRTRHRKPRKF